MLRIICLIILFPTLLVAKNETIIFRGLLIDKDSNEPISRVHVFGETNTGKTDDAFSNNGKFDLEFSSSNCGDEISLIFKDLGLYQPPTSGVMKRALTTSNNNRVTIYLEKKSNFEKRVMQSFDILTRDYQETKGFNKQLMDSILSLQRNVVQFKKLAEEVASSEKPNDQDQNEIDNLVIQTASEGNLEKLTVLTSYSLNVTVPYSTISPIVLISKDSMLYCRLGIGTQLSFSSTNSGYSQLQVKRLRIKLNGYLLNPKLNYGIQLGFSNMDMRLELDSIPEYSPLLDGYFSYRINRNIWLRFGQFRVKGNRESLTTYNNIQLTERSALDSLFSLDRDLGVEFTYTTNIGNGMIYLSTSVTQGEGRMNHSFNKYFAYSSRLELLPFGRFHSKGQYIQSDIKREPVPKLAIGIAYSFNHNTPRQSGQLGTILTDQFNTRIIGSVSSLFFDAILKYHGMSLSGEYATKNVQYELERLANDSRYQFRTGNAFNVQGSYLLNNDLEFIARYTTIEASKNSSFTDRREYTLGINKHIGSNKIQLQSDLTLQNINQAVKFGSLRFQITVKV